MGLSARGQVRVRGCVFEGNGGELFGEFGAGVGAEDGTLSD